MDHRERKVDEETPNRITQSRKRDRNRHQNIGLRPVPLDIYHRGSTRVAVTMVVWDSEVGSVNFHFLSIFYKLRMSNKCFPSLVVDHWVSVLMKFHTIQSVVILQPTMAPGSTRHTSVDSVRHSTRCLRLGGTTVPRATLQTFYLG